MDDIVTERSRGILRIELNRPEKLNAMTSGMYTKLADIFNDAAKDECTRVVLWHGAGDAFSAGNDVRDFLENPPGRGASAQSWLMNALVDFDKPLIAAVRGAAIGAGTTMLLHCDFVYAGESARFQMPCINLALVPEFGSSCLVPLTIGYIRAAELILLGLPFDARRAEELGLVTQVVYDQNVLQVAIETALDLAEKPASALQAAKRLLKRSFREHTRAAIAAENEVFSVQVCSEEAMEILTALLVKRPSHLTETRKPVMTT
jgi:enoyl-CoA hydratase/carnithine racemase